MVGLIVILGPVGLGEFLVFISNILELISKLIEGGVVHVVSGVVLIDVVLKAFSNVLPLRDESLSSWGGKEFLVKFVDGSNLFGVSPSLERRFEVSDWLGVLDGFPGVGNIFGLAFDSLLSLFGDLNLKHVGDVVGGDKTKKSSNCNSFHFCGVWKFLIKNIFNSH